MKKTSSAKGIAWKRVGKKWATNATNAEIIRAYGLKRGVEYRWRCARNGRPLGVIPAADARRASR